ncbi:MAG: HAD family hydrolase [Desulfuromonadales bacterium]
MTGIRGVIFDCDGVLFSSLPANLAYYNAILTALGEPPVLTGDREKIHLCHTAASPQVFAGLLGEGRVQAALSMAADLDFRRFIPEMRPEPDMADSLARLAQRFSLAVATNRGTSMDEILQYFKLDTYFRTVITSRDVPRPKPWPDMLLLAAERLELTTGQLLFVGDSELDQAAAQAAGMRFAAYKTDLPGDVRVGSYKELMGILQTVSVSSRVLTNR